MTSEARYCRHVLRRSLHKGWRAASACEALVHDGYCESSDHGFRLTIVAAARHLAGFSSATQLLVKETKEDFIVASR